MNPLQFPVVETAAGLPNQVEIPRGSVLGGGALVALLGAVLSWGTFFLVDLPSAKASRAETAAQTTKVQNDFQLDLIQRALQNDSLQARVQSLMLLIDAGLLNDSDGKLKKLLQAPAKIPQWEKEPTKSTFLFPNGANGPVTFPVKTPGS